MSGSKNEDQPCTRIDDVEPEEKAQEQVQHGTTEKAVEQNRMDSPISPSTAENISEKHTLSTNVTVAHPKASTAQSGTEVLVEGLKLSEKSGTKVPVEGQDVKVEGVVQVRKGQSSLCKRGFRAPEDRTRIAKSEDHVSIEQTTLSEKLVKLSLEVPSEESDARDILERQFQPENCVQVEILGEASQSKSMAPVTSCEGQAAQAEICVRIPTEGQATQEGSDAQDTTEGQESQAESLVEFLLDVGPLNPMERFLLQSETSVQVPSEQRASRVQTSIHSPSEGRSPAESSSQVPIEEQASQPESLVEYLLDVGPLVQFPIEGLVLQAERSIRAAFQEQAECSSKVPSQEYASDESLVEFLLEGGPIVPVPLDRRETNPRPVVNLPEISVENILRGTRGQRNQSLFPARERRPPYRSLTQRMYHDERSEVVDLNKERQKKKKRFRCRYEDDTPDTSSSSEDEEPQPPKSDSSPELQFPMDMSNDEK